MYIQCRARHRIINNIKLDTRFCSNVLFVMGVSSIGTHGGTFRFNPNARVSSNVVLGMGLPSMPITRASSNVVSGTGIASLVMSNTRASSSVESDIGVSSDAIISNEDRSYKILAIMSYQARVFVLMSLLALRLARMTSHSSY